MLTETREKQSLGATGSVSFISASVHDLPEPAAPEASNYSRAAVPENQHTGSHFDRIAGCYDPGDWSEHRRKIDRNILEGPEINPSNYTTLAARDRGVLLSSNVGY
jgi:hypothetical protein